MTRPYFLENPLRWISTAALPLCFDLFIEKESESTFPLCLPVELSYRIIGYLSTDELKSLALVDQSCLNLARSVLFRTITDPTPPLLNRVIAESQSPSETKFSIGCWVRRLVLIDPYVPTEDGAWDQYCIRLFSSLPNLTQLSWNGVYAYRTPRILDILMDLPLRALSLDIPLREGDESDNQDLFTKEAKWELEHLNIYVRLPLNKRGSPEPLRPPTRLLKALVSKLPTTLQTLSWRYPLNEEMIITDTRLPNLQSVLGIPNCLPASVFADSRIRRLSIDVTHPTLTLHKLTIPTLRKLEWVNSSHSSTSQFMTFLRAHPQLEFLTINSPVPHHFIQTELLPLLYADFRFLTALRLDFNGPGVPVSCLEFLTQITTLRALWLSSSAWAIDHELLLRALHALPFLEDLSFTGDTYRVPSGTSNPAYYYDLKLIPVDVDWKKYLRRQDDVVSAELPLADMMTAWERWHAETMLEHARKYAVSIPSLRECFLGQLSMIVDEKTRVPGLLVAMRYGTQGSEEVIREKWGITIC